MTDPKATIDQLVKNKAASRLFNKDHTLWIESARQEAKERLNWVDPFSAAPVTLTVSAEITSKLQHDGVTRVVLCGMGGSSLGPEVLAKWAQVPLELLDSTHPSVVQNVISSGIDQTAVVVSSKSGSTVETRSHLTCFEAAFTAAGIDPRDRIIIVTDPGSQLETYAHSQGYRVVCADPNVGGRFSVLTAFGIVPSVLAGVDMAAIISDAQSVQESISADSPANPAFQLAAALYAGLPERYIAVITEETGTHWGLGEWIEQLVAESTGKSGVGILPIALKHTTGESSSAFPHVLNVHLSDSPDLRVEMIHDSLHVRGNLGAQFLLWETATALLGHLMGIDPFNQPDVESAKIAARQALQVEDSTTDVAVTELNGFALVEALSVALGTNGYLAIQAYLQPNCETLERIERLRDRLERLVPAPVALGWGPRYLHSTGQLHKGGPATGVFLQIIDDQYGDYEIPESEVGFGALIRAQADGDRTVLREHLRPVFVLTQADLPELERAIVQLTA